MLILTGQISHENARFYSKAIAVVWAIPYIGSFKRGLLNGRARGMARLVEEESSVAQELL